MMRHHKLDYHSFGPHLRYIAGNLFRNANPPLDANSWWWMREGSEIEPSLYAKTANPIPNPSVNVFMRGCDFIRDYLGSNITYLRDKQLDDWIFSPETEDSVIPSASSLSFLKNHNVRGAEEQSTRLMALDEELKLLASHPVPVAVKALERTNIPDVDSAPTSSDLDESDSAVNASFVSFDSSFVGPRSDTPLLSSEDPLPDSADLSAAIEARFGKQARIEHDVPTARNTPMGPLSSTPDSTVLAERRHQRRQKTKKSEILSITQRSRTRQHKAPLAFMALLHTENMQCKWTGDPPTSGPVTVDMIFNERVQRLIIITGGADPHDLPNPFTFVLTLEAKSRNSRKYFLQTLDTHWV